MNTIEGLSITQWRNVFNTLCDGVEDAALPLTYMRQFKDCMHMYFWLQKNSIRGKGISNMFLEKGNLGAVKYIRDRMQGRKFTSENLQVGDLI